MKTWLRTALCLAVLAAILIVFGSLRHLLAEAFAELSLAAVLAVIPGQIAASLLCAGGIWALQPGVSYLACLASRLLRDAGDNLLVFFPGLGEVIGARSLVLAGGQTHAAIAASVLDKLAETLAQVPFILIAIWVFYGGLKSGLGALPFSAATAGVFLAGLLFAIAAVLKWSGWSGRIGEEWRRLKAEMIRLKSGLPLSTALHFIAWITGGVQLWMASAAL